MSGRRALLVFAVFLAGLAALTWTAMVALQTPFSGTRSERAAVEAALARLGVAERSWRTMSAGASVTRPVPLDAVSAALVRLDRWAEWSGAAEGSAASAVLAPGTVFEEARPLGFPLGTERRRYRAESVVPLAEVVLVSDDGGEKVCRLFRLHESGEGRTTLVAAEVRHGTVTGLSSPLVRSRLTRRLRAAAVALLASAARSGPPRP